MGCGPLNTPKDHDQTALNHHLIFTSDERLKLKEVWVVVKQNGLKKLGDDLMNRALEKNSTLKTYWQHLALNDPNNSLTFEDNDTIATAALVWKETFRQHGYKLLEKIDQLILIMVIRLSTSDANDSILNEQFHRIGESHLQYQVKQDHIDVICESFGECLKDMMHRSGSEWTIKHAITWQKFLTLITNEFSSVTTTSHATKPFSA